MIKFYLQLYNLVVSPISSLRKVEEQDYGLELLNSLKERSPKAWHDYIEKSIEGWARHRQIIYSSEDFRIEITSLNARVHLKKKSS